MIVINRLKRVFVEITEGSPPFLSGGREDFVGKIRFFHRFLGFWLQIEYFFYITFFFKSDKFK